MQCTRYLLIMSILCLASSLLKAQDIHFSQFYYNPQSQNPSLSGSFDGDHRISVNYRNQWLAVPVPYMSASLFYDSRFRLHIKDMDFGVGGGVDYDQAGDGNLSIAKLNGSINGNYYLGKMHTFTLGLAPGIAQRRLSSEKFRWDAQWDGETYDPSLPTKENFNATGKFFFDLGAGAAYKFAFKKRTYLQLGMGSFHLTKPNQSFYGLSSKKAKLPIRNAYHASLSVGIGSLFDVLINGQLQQQEKYEEKVGVVGLRLYLNRTPGSLLNLVLSCGMRDKDAFFPALAVEWNNWMLSGSYDINTSPFQTATNKRGGPEVALQYIFRSVKRIGVYKKCPLY